MERPGLRELLAAITRADIGVLIIEDVDRLSRDAEHLHYMVKLLRLNRVAVHTVAAGQIDDLVLGFKAIIGEQQRARIAYTTRRGLKAKAKRGGATGGKTLGYVREITGTDASGVPSDRLAIQPDEAKLVRRIFHLYAEGRSLKRICRILNDEGVPSPRARESGKYNAGIWNPSTLSSDPALGEGILNNETYIGRRIFNQRTWVEVPNDQRGFRRQPRVNPQAEWIINEEPELRIVDQQLREQVKARQVGARAAQREKFKTTGNPLNGAKRPSHLLSGLVTCGTCGQPFIGTGYRWRCKATLRHACDNSSIRLEELERRALAGIRHRLLTPEVVARFAVELQRELDEQLADTAGDLAHLRSALDDKHTKIANIVRRIEDDIDAPRALGSRLKDLEPEEADIAARLANSPPQAAIRVPSDHEAIYAQAVAELDRHFADLDAATARAAVRQLIEQIIVHPGVARSGKPRRIELRGDLFRLLIGSGQGEDVTDAAVADALVREVGGGVTSVVAGTCSHLGLLTSSNWSTLQPR